MPRTIFENIVIQHFEKTSFLEFCQYTPIRFFEILQIQEGKGVLKINGHNVPYEKSQLFVFIPNDEYNFEIEEETTVSAVKFLYNFFNNFSGDNNQSQLKEWFKKIETILHGANRATNLKLRSETEKSSLLSLFKVLCNEYNDQTLRNEVILRNTLHSVLYIVSRNVDYEFLKTGSSKIQEIVRYIHYYIHDANKISNAALADEFNISENYISQYFKKQMGLSLKKYILNYKIKLAETRLKYTDLTYSEIASELGFTDSSHLDKTFLSYKGITPSAYRQNQKNI
ncbi:helix-turn-helix domain-containing protein [Seonamhaeicola marinus]|uniref:Helix-turn-helix transcriptional regulator n=1 Tax=Seonamhaeicola marinus TaxID=1912246 RepID=A0A5D0IMS2_9FLAO|nr:AraC family transcriptional regulator [Seonamhaeicola marinus]TYA84319.1 helix-turn-helix transcriptional regulator [Seonamhaeicola marinus]